MNKKNIYQRHSKVLADHKRIREQKMLEVKERLMRQQEDDRLRLERSVTHFCPR